LQVAGMAIPETVVILGATVAVGATVVLKLFAGAAAAEATKKAAATREDGVYMLILLLRL